MATHHKPTPRESQAIRAALRPGVSSMNTIAANVDEFVEQWLKGPLNGDEIYSLHYTPRNRFGEAQADREVKLLASELKQLLDERNYDRNLIGRLERSHPDIADELKLQAP